MKIILDCRLISYKPTGISRFSIYYANFIIARYGAENVIIITNGDSFPHDCIEHKISLKPFNLMHYMIFHRFINKLNADLYISFQYSSFFFKPKNLRVITTVHDLMFYQIPNFFGSKMKNIVGKFYYNLIVKRSLKMSDDIFSVSMTTAHDIKKIYNLNSLVTGEGLFLEDSESVSFYKKLGLTKRKYFLYIGNNRPHKNVNTLIGAFNSFREENIDFKLVLVGHQGDSNEDIIYTGYLDDSEIVNLYKNAKAFVFPSFYEGFGLPILEAFSNDCPVIASDIPAFREFECDNVIYFSPKSKENLLLAMNSDLEFTSNFEYHKVMENQGWSSTHRILINYFDGIINLN